MPTLRAFRQEMLRLEPGLGRIQDIASGSATTLVVAALATGVIGSGKFIEKWMLRPSTLATADRVRMCKDFESGAGSGTAGTLTHEGANYTDTTFTGEQVELLEHEPYLYDNAIQQAIASTRFLHNSLIPTHLTDRYWLHDLGWIRGPADIVRVYRRPSRVISRNRKMDDWFGYSAGALVPDHWALAGSGATFSRSTDAPDPQRYSLQVVRNGTTWTVTQTVGLLETGVAADSLQGQKVTGVLRGLSSVASALTVRVTDGVDTTDSDAHGGGGDWEELTAEHTINDSATTLQVQARGAQDGTDRVAELYIVVGVIDDTIRRDFARHDWEDFRPRFEQGATQRLVVPSTFGRGAQLVLETQRPYEPFTQSRIDAGSADGDENDAPLDLIAHGAIWRLYEDLARSNPETYGPLAADWEKKFRQRQGAHLHIKRERTMGVDVPGAGPVGRLVQRVR